MTCDQWTHPLGNELRCEIDDERFQTKAAGKLQELIDASGDWRAELKENNWTE